MTKKEYVMQYLKDSFVVIENNLKNCGLIINREKATDLKKTYFVLLGMSLQWNPITGKMIYRF